MAVCALARSRRESQQAQRAIVRRASSVDVAAGKRVERSEIDGRRLLVHQQHGGWLVWFAIFPERRRRCHHHRRVLRRRARRAWGHVVRSVRGPEGVRRPLRRRGRVRVRHPPLLVNKRRRPSGVCGPRVVRCGLRDRRGDGRGIRRRGHGRERRLHLVNEVHAMVRGKCCSKLRLLRTRL